jgi:hypothetical protein
VGTPHKFRRSLAENASGGLQDFTTIFKGKEKSMGTAKVGTDERPNAQATVVFVREVERPERQRCGDYCRSFGERGRVHKTENLETVGASGA